MPSHNRVTLLGRLGADPELRYSQAGKAIAKFRIATDDGWGDRKKTNWHSIVVFGAPAEKYVGPYVRKGDLVLVEGRVSYRQYEGRWYTDIIADSVQGCGARSDERSSSSAPPKQAKLPASEPDPYDGAGAFDDTDIPFDPCEGGW